MQCSPVLCASLVCFNPLLPVRVLLLLQVRSLSEMQQLIAPAAAAKAAGQQPPPLQQQVVDARPAGRFKGVDPEPRPGLKQGHMPGAKNVPFMQVCVGRQQECTRTHAFCCSFLLIVPRLIDVPQVYADNQMAGAKLKAVDELQDVFEDAGVDVQAPLVCR